MSAGPDTAGAVGEFKQWIQNAERSTGSPPSFWAKWEAFQMLTGNFCYPSRHAVNQVKFDAFALGSVLADCGGRRPPPEVAAVGCLRLRPHVRLLGNCQRLPLRQQSGTQRNGSRTSREP